MKTSRLITILSVCIFCAAYLVANSFADTIIMNDGKEIKGIIVEDYRDRVTFSTVDGEVSVMKSGIRELSYDTDEDNLIKLGDRALDHRDYAKALGYYEMVLKANPDSAAAKQGMAYLRANLYRKEELLKTADIKRQQDIERYGGQAAMYMNTDDVSDMARTLEKSTGMRISIKGNMPEAVGVKPNSPAYEAGIRDGDLLISVWSKLTGYISMREILDFLVNKSAMEIRCVIQREYDVAINNNRSFISKPEDLIGASFTMEIDGLTISTVKEGGNAFESGIRAGDLVVAIDGEQTRYMPLKKAIELIKNSKSEIVKLTIRRDTIIWRRKA